jgi:hypothetical protein
MLADVSEDESNAAPPFLGLTSRVEVDRLFGTASTTVPIELPPGRKLTPGELVNESETPAIRI